MNYVLLEETAKDICRYYGKNLEEMEEWEVCELLDKFIDEKLGE